MAKFRHFEESRIQLGVGEVHIQEVSDGVHLTISEEVDNSIRLGIPDKHGVNYNYWRDIVKILREKEDTIFELDKDVELAEGPIELAEDKQDGTTPKHTMRPELVRYFDKQETEWIAIKLVSPNGDQILVSWETKTDNPIPTISFNLDLIKSSKKIGRTTFYEELKAVCDRILE